MSVAPIRQLKNRHGFQPFEQDFSYTGNVQSFTVPAKGLYKIELWGGSGGNGYLGGSGGNGGYTIGYMVANKNDVWYIGVGGRGSNASSDTSGARFNGGYNGGGYGGCDQDGWNVVSGGGGGGATHIGLSNNVLKETSNANILAVAGGGGAGIRAYDVGDHSVTTFNGGSGGGTSGGNSNGAGADYWGKGGTQSTGNAKGQGGNAGYSGGGGGGYYGGWGGNSYACGGGGGSGYIGGVPSVTYKGQTYNPSTNNNNNSGNGKAKITRIA